jgi:hypothetical protein
LWEKAAALYNEPTETVTFALLMLESLQRRKLPGFAVAKCPQRMTFLEAFAPSAMQIATGSSGENWVIKWNLRFSIELMISAPGPVSIRY